jgi:inosose dehydratase
MITNRRTFLAHLSFLSATLAKASFRLPANRNVKWALSSALWGQFHQCPFTSILDVMKETGFIGLRLAGAFAGEEKKYGMSAAQLEREVSKRGLHIVTVSFGSPLADPTKRQAVLDSAREAMKKLTDCGANHLVVFPPGRAKPGAEPRGAFEEMCARCNQIGELAGEMGFTAGLHNHMGAMVQTPQEVDRFMSLTNPKLFGLSPDTYHLHMGGSDVVEIFARYKTRIHFMDYKDASNTPPPEGSQDLGDGAVDFPGCHRVLKSVHYHGWICVDLDTARKGPLASYQRCAAYVTRVLQPIYL